jgi:hypothetical protein
VDPLARKLEHETATDAAAATGDDGNLEGR